jgi:hypothetical protein
MCIGYLKEFDPDVHAPGQPYPSGHVATTWHEDEALKFADHMAAMMFYSTVSRASPKRPDGRPNRPLTYYTVEILPNDENE